MLYIFLSSSNIQTRIYFKLLHLLTYLLTHWMYGPLRALASLIMEAHSSLSTAFCRHVLTFISRRPFSLSSLLMYVYVKVISTFFGLYTLREWSLCVFPNDGYTYQPKRFGITLIQMYPVQLIAINSCFYKDILHVRYLTHSGQESA